MQIEFRSPPAELGQLVSLFYLYRCDDPVVNGIERADVGQIRFMLKGQGELCFPQGHRERSRRIMINGPGTGAASYRVDGPFHCFGIALRPVGWVSIIQLPADSRADHVTDGEALFGDDARRLYARLGDLDSIDAMVDAVTPFLLNRARPVPGAHVALVERVREWLAGEAPRVEDLFASTPLSPRQVTRLVNRYFGGPPKLLERKFRALRAAIRLIEGADFDAVASQFYDQSHMIREIRHFTGHTPGSLESGLDPVLAVTLASSKLNELGPPG